MTNAITVYKQLTYIETYDGELIPLTQDFKVVTELVNNDQKFINVGNELIAKSNIKRVFTKMCDEIDNLIILIADKNVRAKVQAEVEVRRKQLQRLNLDIVKNIIERVKKEI